MTPIEHCPDLAKAIGLSDLYLKREDLHPYGSHKGRSIPAMIDHYYQSGDRHFAISSSGNAALAASLYVQELNAKNSTASKTGDGTAAGIGSLINLDIYVGKNITDHKLEKLRNVANSAGGEHIKVIIKDRPLFALNQAVEEGARSLRQSTDDVALKGYISLAEELASVKDAGAIFIGTSSGTTAQALAEYFLAKKLPIQIHIVQTSSCHPIADSFETIPATDERSIADAIVGLSAPRKAKLVPLIEKTGGHGWVASNEEIETAIELTRKHAGIEISNNSALSIVGAMQAAYQDWKMKGPAICLVCGD